MIREIFIWWLTAQGFGLIGLPLTLFFFRALPDQGYAFSKAFGLLLSGYLAWLLAMLGLAPFGRVLIIVCALIVGGIGLLVRSPKTEPRPADQPQFSMFNLQFSIPRRWRLILAYEALFLAALLFLVFLRSYNYQLIINPNPWGTERPMDYALFNAIRHSASFPPHDPWLSGYSINYYYFGYLLMAAVSLVSGVDQVVAYNLSLALIFALTALGVAGIVNNLIGLTKNQEPRTENRQSRFSVLSSWFWPLLTVVLVLFAGNQGGTLQLVTGTSMSLALDGRDMGRAIVNGLGSRQPLELQPPFKGWDFDGTKEISPTNMVTAFDWWPASRAVWDAYADPDNPSGQPSRRYTITEFPFFSFWLGDMHPHVMALPFGLLALALALQTIVRPAAPTFAMGRRGWVELALTGVTLGSLYLINSWDLPTYLLLFLGALLLLYARLGRMNQRLGMGNALPPNPNSQLPTPVSGIWWRHLLNQAMLALLAAWLLFVPFHVTFRSLVGGKEPLINLPVLATITRTIGIVTSSRTSLQNFLIIFGLMLLPLVAFVLAQSRSIPQAIAQLDETTDDAVDVPTGLAENVPPKLAATPLSTLSWRYLPLVLLGVLVLGVLVGFPLLVLLPLAVYAARLAFEHVERPVLAFVLWAFALVCLVCFGTEIIYIRDVFEGSSSRMNTIFKFYYQAWLIWGVLAGYAIWWLFSGRPTTDDRRLTTKPHLSFIVQRSSLVVGVVFVALLTSALVYPVLTAGKAFREGERVGIAGKTKREEKPEDIAAIAWLRANAPDTAIVLEATGSSFDYDTNGLGYGQVSGSTGLATVLGWKGHEEQWRGGDPAVMALLGPRENDVKTIYSAGDVGQARALLQKYEVSFIYVGAAERAAYQVDMAKLGQLGESVLPPGDVAIFRVK